MPLSAREVRVAESLLRFMRDPADLLESVSESIEIGSRELRREVTLRLRPGSFGKKQKWAYLDVLHPRKGGAAEIRVDSPDEVARIALLAWATAGPIMPTASLVVGLLAVGALVVTPPIGPGVLGFPLLSRFTPAFLAVVSVVFIFWLASLDAVPSFAIGHDPVGTVLRALWATWCLAGGWALVAAALVATVRMGARRHALFRNFRAATVRPNPRSSNFF